MTKNILILEGTNCMSYELLKYFSDMFWPLPSKLVFLQYSEFGQPSVSRLWTVPRSVIISKLTCMDLTALKKKKNSRLFWKGKAVQNICSIPAACLKFVTREKRVELQQYGSNAQMQLRKACFILGVGAKWICCGVLMLYKQHFFNKPCVTRF